MSGDALAAIIGCSRPIVELRELIRTIAPTRLPILIEGPTGSGKELVASAIHQLSGRRGQFVAFNVCAIGETMFEDALFGHTRGAFTGATNDSLGFLREADQGTTFFDEIGGLHLMLQAKLLRAIEIGEFRPIGARRDARSDFRVVAATNEPIDALVKAGRLRADLAHRLAGVVVEVPALHERPEDIPLLVQHFLERTGRPMVVDQATLDALMKHAWPGNVRELRNVVECAAAIGGLGPQSVLAVLARRNGTELRVVATRRNELKATLEAHKWDATSAASALGVHRATLYRWMKEARLAPE